MNHRLTMLRVTTTLALAVMALAGCDKDKDKAPLAPAASSLAPSVAAAPGAHVFRLAIDPKSTSTIDMPAPKEHIKAHTDAAERHEHFGLAGESDDAHHVARRHLVQHLARRAPRVELGAERGSRVSRSV